ncbi:hypothetical protein [Candidatus Enterococcus clewellii]|uniref:MFS transporter n=1 Tax=Candidatus Enterococcus clewellii TaxID=1834193 RepID=A0A242K7W6_9ENTE|nr:hypothetical protein [Enterococcus sp. 9E7_DIV0242]OTP17157.1 hypothetical protein A5888_001295 [Enterococcus sp. 9E7_DIV0242]
MPSTKSVTQKLFPAVPFVLTNTITFVPYLVFLTMHTGSDMESVLPFVLFYTVRMTGIFLLKSFRLGLATLHVLLLSLICGGIGSFFGILGEWWYPCYFLSAVLIGLSAAWLPPANTTIKYQRKELKIKQAKTSFFDFVFLVVLLGIFLSALVFDFPGKTVVIFTEYTLLYLIAFRGISGYPIPDRKVDKIDQKTFFMKEFLLFLVYFILLIIIRLARALFDSNYLTVAMMGFSAFLIIAAWYINSVHHKWKLPIWLNMLSFINGMCMNYILLFGTFYTAFYFGNNKIALYLYVPYILGILTSKLLMRYVYQMFAFLDREVIHIIGLIGSLLLMLLPVIFPIAVFLFSFFISGTSTYLNQLYAQNEELPENQQIIIKYTTQAKGSITHQFLLMTGLWIMVKEFGLSMNTVLQITAHKSGDLHVLRIVDTIHYLSIGLLLYLLFFILYERLFKNKKMPFEE